MYANVIVYSHDDKYHTEAFFVKYHNGDMSEIISGRNVSVDQFLEYVAFAMYRGCAVRYLVCDRQYRTIAECEFQRDVAPRAQYNYRARLMFQTI